MPEFLKLLPPGEALTLWLQKIHPIETQEEVLTSEAVGRVTTQRILAPHALPTFTRSNVDGYSVQAKDTHGASDNLPVYMKIVGEVPMGSSMDFQLKAGECALIHTGGMLPQGSDSVVMLEYTQALKDREVEIYHPIAVGENVLWEGEDVKPGEEVIPEGQILRPAELGGLMALGITNIIVSQKPRVGIISSGDEIVPPEKDLLPGQVRDINAYTLSGVIHVNGGIPVRYGITPDDESALQAAVEKALIETDMVVITAGSSASSRDLTAKVVNKVGKPGVLVHGVNIRPGKPTILAICSGKPVIGLPGNPVSALVIAQLFIAPVIKSLLGIKRVLPIASIPAKISLNYPSQAGREDWVPVRLISTEKGFIAEPVFGKSNLIFTLVRADGLVRIPPDSTGISAGEEILVLFL